MCVAGIGRMTPHDPAICFQLMSFRSCGNNSPISGLVSAISLPIVPEWYLHILRSFKLAVFESLWSIDGSLSWVLPTKKLVLGCGSSTMLLVHRSIVDYDTSGSSQYQFEVGYSAV
jgi:hypothetical protein